MPIAHQLTRSLLALLVATLIVTWHPLTVDRTLDFLNRELLSPNSNFPIISRRNYEEAATFTADVKSDRHRVRH